jgi:hypothetical protein
LSAVSNDKSPDCLSPAKVSSASEPLDGDANGTAGGDFSLDLHRLYGDVNGDGTVNGLDLAEFRTAFGASNGDAN